MGMEVVTSGDPSNPTPDFADLQMDIEEKSRPHSDEYNNSNNQAEEENQERGGIEEEGRIGGILHPNEKLPRPEPPPGVALLKDGVQEPLAPPASGDGESDGFASIGRFIRQRSSVIAKMIYRTEEEGEQTTGGQNEDVVTELELPPGTKLIVLEKGSLGSHALKGRVTFFSRSNCRDCGAVRSFLREKGVCYVEINLDVYPMREAELTQRTGGSTVPKIFFNDKLIGGLTELNAIRRSPDLEAKLKELLSAKCPDGDVAVPAAPAYGFDDVVEETADEMIGIVRILKQKLPIQDRLIKMRIVSNCFAASDLIDLLHKHLGCDRNEGVEIGGDLIKKHFIHPVFGDHEFRDGNHVYRFLDHEPYIPKCYNFRGSTNELEPKLAYHTAPRLGKIMSAILESYASQDRQFVDYISISNSEEFRRYLNLVHDLQRADMSSLAHNDKLAFFLNLYNAMVIHAVIRLGHPQGMMDRKSMHNDFQYLVGGQPYSLTAIKNGILRGNRRPPYTLAKPFGSGDKRLEVALPSVNPLIHFGLCDGTRSAPTVRFFTPENVDAELRVSTRDFFSKGTIEVDLTKRTVYLSSIIKWYSADFGSDKEMLKWVINYLGASNAGLVTHLLGDYGTLNIMYQGYDWSLNS